MKPHLAPARYDVVGIGNAIVDVLARAEDSFIGEHNLTKGAMTLIDEAAADRLYAAMGPGRECSGGSAANTIAALASIGGRCAFVGKVRDDQLGRVFAHDIRALGVAFETAPATRGASTARCLIFVTPDAQRTMQTFLGASVGLASEDIDAGMMADSRIVYLEGYLWDPPAAKEAFRKAAKAANDAGRLVALSLSDPFCVDRHRGDFRDLVERHVDLLFANEEEIKSLYRVASFDEALQKVRGHCRVAALTRSAKGAVVVAGDEVHVIDAEPIAKVVDTTGAGDAFAAGFLYGFTHGFDLARAARAGAIAAAEAISHFGARPEAPLKSLIADRLGAL
jgi:sugar/nucleoside kinase (ribokinase family)